MRFLRTNTAVRITVGPFLDKTDGVTPETGLTVTSCKLTLMVDDSNVPTLVLDTNPTASGGANDMVHVTGDDAGFYDLELAAANVNYLGRAMLAITDGATHCPVFHEFMILPAMIYDSLVLGTDRLDTNVTHIGDTLQTARDIGASVLLSSGTGTGQLDFTSGIVKSNMTQITGNTAGATNLNTIFNTDYATIYDTTNKAFLSKLGNFAMGGSSLNLTLGTFGCSTITASGAVAFQSTFAVTGTTTLTGAVTASNASNNIVGIDVAKISGDATAADNLEAALDGTGSVTITANLTGNVTGNLSGSVGSVTGAVGSVTGNVGGNVTGSVGSVSGNVGGNVVGTVASVVGAVGSVTGNVGGNVTGSVGSLATQAKLDVNAEVDTALADYDAPTNAEMVARTLVAASYATATNLQTVDDNVDAILLDTAEIGAAGAGLSAIPKTGFKLASDGLDSISTTAPSGVASNFREMVVQTWRRFFKKSTLTSTQLKTYADDGSTVLTTQTVSDDLTTETMGTSA